MKLDEKPLIKMYELSCLFSPLPLQIVQSLKLLPFTVEAVEQKVNAFRHYTDEVRVKSSRKARERMPVGAGNRKQKLEARLAFRY